MVLISKTENAIGDDLPYKDEPIQILPNLYLGSEINAANRSMLNRLNIEFILNVGKEVENPYLEEITNANSSYFADSFHQISPGLQTNSSVSSEDIPATSDFKPLKYKKFFWTHNQENLIADFIPAFAFIDEARSAGRNILVHCQCGVSRSASLIISYVMKVNRMTLNQAYEYVKDKSPYISPNMSLVYQLVEFEKTLK
ncbi:phosphatases II, partial [Rhizophagus irregularis]